MKMRQCPFCAYDGVRVETQTALSGDHYEYRGTCFNCGAYGPDEMSKERAIKSWNMRRETYPPIQVETKERQMQKPVQIWDDERPVRSVSTQGEGYSVWAVGRGGVTRIVAYRENGQGAPVPWFAVYEGDWLAHRVNAAAVESVWYGSAADVAEGESGVGGAR